MIERYSRKEIQKIWSNENKFTIWTEIECLIAEKLSLLGIIPKVAAKDIRKKAKFNIKEISKIEKDTKHDVVAYIENVSSYIGENSKYFHYGVTSSDIIDTAFSTVCIHNARYLKQKSHFDINGSVALLLHNTLKSSAILGLSFFAHC